MRVLLCTLFGVLIAMGPAIANGNHAGQIDVLPPEPTTEDTIVLMLSGTWPDSCVPSIPQVMQLGSFIYIATSHTDEVCAPTLTPWQLEVPLGELAAGQYRVVMAHTDQTGDTDVVGQGGFIVQDHADDPEVPCVNPYHPGLMMLIAAPEEIPGGASLPLALIVTAATEEQVHGFRTSQRFDFAIYDDAGEEVWRWSDEQAFLMVMGEETYTMGGVLYFARMDTADLPAPGTYTIQGTLTTEGRADREEDSGPAHVCTTFELIPG